MPGDSTTDCLVYEATDLLPACWNHFSSSGPVRAFNPGLLRDGDDWIFACRIVGPDGRRRISLCRLDSGFRIVPGSQLGTSDNIRFRPDGGYPEIATRWFADPRLYRLDGRLFLYWNSGWHEPRNYQFLVEIDPNKLTPCGIARELVLSGSRQKLEKNWTLFEPAPGEIRILYSITPQRLLACSLDGRCDIVCEPFASMECSLAGYPPHHGGLRGGAPPVRLGADFWSFGHTIHDGPDGYCYAAAATRFSAAAPFAPTALPHRPLDLGLPCRTNRRYERLNPAVDTVIYPCGADHEGSRWIISHGINDEQCAISLVPDSVVEATLKHPACSP
jgi:hypothetical protein